MKRRCLHLVIALLAFGSPDANARGVKPHSAHDFLQSIGVCIHVQHGQDPELLAPMLRYTGIANVRDAIDKNYSTQGLLHLHQLTGCHILLCAGSGASDPDLPATLSMARELHRAGALLAIEGPNEPNNFGGLTYQGEAGGGNRSWLPVARFQRDLYAQVMAHPELRHYPVVGISEIGAQTDNTGLQFLTIPDTAHCLMPAGTRYADCANVHNYMYHPAWQGLADNRVWMAASPGSDCPVDGIWGNHGRTWLCHHPGYTEQQLNRLPRWTTETGVRVGDCDGAVTERVQACHYLNVFLAQYKRGWQRTFIYELTDDGDGRFGFYQADYHTPRLAAHWMHRFTTILSDPAPHPVRGRLSYSLKGNSNCVHDLLLQKADGTYCLVLWAERAQGEERVQVCLKKRRTVHLLNPTTSHEEAQPSGPTRNVSLTLSDHPVILTIK